MQGSLGPAEGCSGGPRKLGGARSLRLLPPIAAAPFPTRSGLALAGSGSGWSGTEGGGWEWAGAGAEAWQGQRGAPREP